MPIPDKIEELFIKLKPILGEEKAKRLWLSYHTAPTQRKYIESLLYIWASKYLGETYEKKEILLSPIPEDKAKGEYPLGIVFYGDKPLYHFCLREDEWLHHVAIFGRSGSGKTMTAFLILWNFLNKKKPFLVFDWKRNYRDFLSIADNMLIFTIGRDISPLSWNPLIPPDGISPSVWMRKLIEILCHAYFLGEGVSYLLMKAFDSVFTYFGVYENSARYPTFMDVSKWINDYKAKGREAQWLDSTKRTLAVLCYGEFGKAINSADAMPIKDLLSENVIMELDALTNSDKTFFTEALLLWIHQYRLGQRDREIFRHAILIEEAHHILLKKKQEFHGEEAVTDVILREIRELGESIILIDQHPSLISKPALGNTYTTIAMNLKHGSDIFALADSILLTPGQKEFLGELPTGTAIVKLQGRHFLPFLVKFPSFPLKKGFITDEAIKRKMRGYLSSLSQNKPKEANSEVIRVILSGERKKEFTLNNLESGLLNDVVKHPNSAISERYERAKINPFYGNKAKKKLIEEGLITETEISTGKGRIKSLAPTKKAYEILGMDKPDRQVIGNPSPEHEYWKNRVAEHYRKLGYTVEIEKHIGHGKSVDIAAKNEHENIAIEIETGKSDALYNIQKDIEAGFDRVVSVALSEEVKRKIEREIVSVTPNCDTEKIEILQLMDLINSE